MTAVDDPQTYAIIGAAMHVHKVLGHGFLEQVYHEAFAIEFAQRSIPYVHEAEIPIVYEGRVLNTAYRADFICYDSVIVELKALNALGKGEIAQLLNYLKATGYRVGLLINFGASSLAYNRVRNKFLSTDNPNNSMNPI
jgi:GxxExxY protein